MTNVTHGDDCFCPGCRGDQVPPPGDPAGENNSYQCTDRVVCFGCGTDFGSCNDLKGKLNMLPDGSGNGATSGRRSGSGMVYLKNEHLSTTPKGAKILAVKYDDGNKFGPRVVVKLALEGQTVFWGLTIKKNPNYTTLLEKFGRDENAWVGKEILIGLEEDSFTNSYFARVTFPAAAPATRSAR